MKMVDLNLSIGKDKMEFYRVVNRLLDKVEFSNKTKLLIAIIAIGMMTIGFLMLISIFALKFDYETLYQKRTIPQVELEEIKDIYTVNIYDTLYDLKEENIDIKNANEVILLAKQIVKAQWTNYHNSINYDIGGLPEFASKWLNFFLPSEVLPEKNAYQKGIVSKIEEKMKKIDNMTYKVFSYINTNEEEHALASVDEVFLEINSINIYLSSLITYHLKEAIAEKIEMTDSLTQVLLCFYFL